MFTVDLSANVPLYGQEQCFYCGPASGQMIRNGYPNPADRLFFSQLYLWNSIQAYNTSNGWYTDPQGLTECLQALSNPPGVDWVTFADTSQDAVLFEMLFWMNRRSYPSAVLVNQGGHWVVVVGFATDVEPLGGSHPTLQQISYHDPEPHNVGTDTTMTGAQWFAGPWNGSIIYAGWLNQYVAVVEPPIQRGKVRVQRVGRTGKRLLSPKQALEYARRWIVELKLGERSKYGILSRRDAIPMDPMLVRDEVPRSRAKDVPYYYIVPFGFKNELDERGSRLARVCVLVNAYTGRFEEVTAFGRPVRYVSEEEALDVVASALQSERRKLPAPRATLMFQPSDITHVRTSPFWRLTIGQRTFYVDQLGRLYTTILPSGPGD